MFRRLISACNELFSVFNFSISSSKTSGDESLLAIIKVETFDEIFAFDDNELLSSTLVSSNKLFFIKSDNLNTSECNFLFSAHRLSLVLRVSMLRTYFSCAFND